MLLLLLSRTPGGVHTAFPSSCKEIRKKNKRENEKDKEKKNDKKKQTTTKKKNKKTRKRKNNIRRMIIARRRITRIIKRIVCRTRRERGIINIRRRQRTGIGRII